jgi:lantibiotic modifying enzyme
MTIAKATWRPVLTGVEADLAHDAIAGIAEDLTRVETDEVGLYGGLSGMALFFGLLHAARPGYGFDDTADELLGRALSLAADVRSLSLSSGISGVAFAAELLAEGNDASDDADPHDEIDELLIASLEGEEWPEYDLVSGVVGIGVYALRRLSSPSGDRLLRSVVEALARMAERTPKGAAYWTSVEHLETIRRLARPSDPPMTAGHYNLGLAHGLPGVVAWLGHAVASGQAPSEATSLLEATMSFLVSERDVTHGYGYFTTPGLPRTASRSAWCYGNPGVGLAIVAAGQGVGRADWERFGIDLLLRETTRPVNECGVRDSSFCHGSFGLAHIYNRAFHSTGLPDFQNAARAWAKYGLALRRPGTGIGGYEAWVGSEQTPRPHRDDHGLLSGSAGIGLVLLGLVTPEAPRWDAALLCNLTAR